MKTRLLFFLLITFGLGIAKTNAQYVWNGGSSGNWTTAGNWLYLGVISTVYPGQYSTSDYAYFSSSNVTVNVTSNVSVSQVESAYGVSGVTINTSSGNTLTISSGLNMGQPSSAATVLTLSGAGKYIISGSSSPSYNASYAFSSGTTVYFDVNSTLDMTNSQKNVTNNGTLIFLSGSKFNLSSSSSAFTNSSTGSIISYAATFNLTASSSAGITNNGSWRDHGSTFNITGQSAGFQNTGTSASFYGSGTTIAIGPTSNNSNSLKNTSSFTVDSGSVVNLKTQNCTLSNSGSSAAFNLSSSTLTLSTANTVNITNSSSATFTATNSTINVSGYQNYISNSATFIAGTSGSPCVINISGSGKSLGSNTSIYNTGTFTLGPTSIINATGTSSSNPNIVYNNGGTFTLQSDATGSATIGTLGAGSSFQGTFNVQRYITPGYRGYRLFSCPINTHGYTPGSSNVIDISYLGSSTYSTGEFIAGPGSGFGTNGTLSHTIANPTIYLYQESALPGANYNQSFISGKNIGISSIGTNSVTTTSTATNGVSTSGVKIPAGNGYISYFIGPYNITSYVSTSPATATTTAPGYINQGTIPLYLWGTSPSSTLTYTTGTGSRNPGYIMAGNPYPSTIDLYALYNDTYNSSNNQKVINPSFYELNDQTQSYVTYNATTGSSGTGNSRYVASGQGFFISVVSNISSVTNKTLTFTENDKPSSTSSAVFPSTLLLAALPPSDKTNVSTGLHLKLIKDNVNYDECGLYFRSDWKDTYNEKSDTYDLDGVSPKVYLSSYSSDGVRTSINALSDYTYGKRIKLFVKATTDGIYKLNLEDLTNIDTTNYSVYLIDKKRNDSLDMVHYKTYTFNFYIADTASFTGRFLLAIEPKLTRPYNLITFSGQKGGGNTILLNWNTANEGNYTTFGLEKLGANGNYTAIDSVQSNSSGVYSFNDPSPIMGNNIYRLAQNDIHGKVTFAGPINVNYNTISVSGMFSIYPNPAKDMINISVNSGVTGSRLTPVYQASIYNLSGVAMDSKQVNTNNWTQNISGYKAGVYILELKTTNGDVVGKTKFVKTN